ncbi:NUDIX domain-containing protein [Cerasicoccus arenae]|uniref:DNA mismatch repair protein MutT n=1 Tax=Cerasicoccus arenae TaxID=424488 RepID=A0A8J3DBL2_9BACT|nr:NUDIX domain-containing protein [Cerasicoccus arenae]MBK1859205.1 NUDIX domain-containing protein [Cerasicoccus arenae]GHC01272.1 DNA mismatch repair protein MutT [Cerasicoccus arenae]
MSASENFFPIPRTVRSASRALIIQHDKLLAIKMKRPREDEIFYILPGGGQRHGETLVQSLLRECREELGLEPIVETVAYVREYIGRNHSFASRHRHFHQLEVVFNCRLQESAHIDENLSGDRNQIGVEWLPLKELAQMNFYPRKILEFVRENSLTVDPLYLGDIN